jgi:hypothetical protein
MNGSIEPLETTSDETQSEESTSLIQLQDQQGIRPLKRRKLDQTFKEYLTLNKVIGLLDPPTLLKYLTKQVH